MSEFAWVVLATAGQLSRSPVLGDRKPVPAQMPSLSWSFVASPGQVSHASPAASPSAFAWSALAAVGQLSQAVPAPSPSPSAWFVLATVGQLSWSPVFGAAKPVPAQMPSLSASFRASPGQVSHASPAPSPSAFAWLALAMEGQLSRSPVLGALNPTPAQMPSLSWSFSESAGHRSHTSPNPSPSALAWLALEAEGQLSQASPTPSASPSVCEALATVGQLSQRSPLPSPSLSVCVALAMAGQLSQASPLPSPSPSAWFVLATVGQLSFLPVLGGLKAFPAQMPSLSWSLNRSSGQGSRESTVPSPSLSWFGFRNSYSPRSTTCVPSALPSRMRGEPSASVEMAAASALFPLSMTGEVLPRW